MEKQTEQKADKYSKAMEDFANWAGNYAEKNNFSLMLFAREHKEGAPTLCLTENTEKDGDFVREVSRAIASQPDILHFILIFGLLFQSGEISKLSRFKREREQS